jgi:hypothetical protein
MEHMKEHLVKDDDDEDCLQVMRRIFVNMGIWVQMIQGIQ